MKYELKNKRFKVELMRDFNFLTAKKISELTVDADEISIDLSRSKIVDSEAIKSMLLMVKSGKKLKIIRPPDVLFETIKILKLESLLNKNDVHVTYR